MWTEQPDDGGSHPRTPASAAGVVRLEEADSSATAGPCWPLKVSAGPEVIEGTSLDISASGARVRLPRTPPGAAVDVELSVPGAGEFFARASIVGLDGRAGEDGHCLDLKWTGVSMRLAHFLEALCIYRTRGGLPHRHAA